MAKYEMTWRLNCSKASEFGRWPPRHATKSHAALHHLIKEGAYIHTPTAEIAAALQTTKAHVDQMYKTARDKYDWPLIQELIPWDSDAEELPEEQEQLRKVAAWLVKHNQLHEAFVPVFRDAGIKVRRTTYRGQNRYVIDITPLGE